MKKNKKLRKIKNLFKEGDVDLFDIDGKKLFSNYKFKFFFEIMDLKKIKKMDLISKKFSINYKSIIL